MSWFRQGLTTTPVSCPGPLGWTTPAHRRPGWATAAGLCADPDLILQNLEVWETKFERQAGYHAETEYIIP